ncbi:MAG TPA: excisionase family DNA-binding protein [Acidimicrobiales bacterium]|nr:excisionase family DNA-binding protein [Acidimicrobiales bacterium]
MSFSTLVIVCWRSSAAGWPTAAHLASAASRAGVRASALEVRCDGLGVDVRHVRRLVHERRIPFVKWGHLLCFDPAEIDLWIDQSRRGLRMTASERPGA